MLLPKFVLLSVTVAAASLLPNCDGFIIHSPKMLPTQACGANNKIITNGLTTIARSPTAPSQQYTNNGRPCSRGTSTRLHNKRWQRLEVEEDDEPCWYLLNCVVGLERDLLRQCRQVCADMPDAHKFVVPTEIKTRSHGANRMVTEAKVKYPGYVFAKVRLSPEVYEAIQGLDRCRSWMGTTIRKGNKRLPPAPLRLNELEVEDFGLEDVEYEEEEEEIPAAVGEQHVIVDEEEENTIDEEALKVYLGLKVDDMVKVTKKGRFHNEDGLVRRLKDGKIFLRFNPYGKVVEEWREPEDVRKLSEIEVLRGPQGPAQPITQREVDNLNKGDDGKFESGVRQRPGRFGSNLMSNVKGAQGPRNRRQDRVQRGQTGDFFGRTNDERRREESNWGAYKENKRGKEGVVADDEWQYRPGSKGDWALSDSDSQWGRPPSQRQQRKEKRQPYNDKSRRSNDEWGKFVSPAPSPAPSEEDDFFASLMTDLSKDLNVGDADSGTRGQQSIEPASSSNESEEDDFFASLMAEIAPETEKESSKNEEAESSMFVDDFFSSLDSSKEQNRKTEKSQAGDPLFDEDELFESFDVVDSKKESDDIFDILDIGKEDSSVGQSHATTEDPDDFFASLERELESALEETEPSSSLHDGDDDFFASLVEEEVSSKLIDEEIGKTSSEGDPQAGDKQPKKKETGGKSQDKTSMSTSGDLESLKVPELKEMLRERGLKVSGKKAELIERLHQ